MKATIFFVLVILFYLAITSSADNVTTTSINTTKITTTPVPYYNLKGKLVRSFNSTSVLFSFNILLVLPDGSFACSGNSKIDIWNSNGKLLRTLTGDWSYASAMVILKNGLLAASLNTSYDSIKIWNYTNSELIKTISGSYILTNGLAVLPNGNLVTNYITATIEPYIYSRQLTIFDVNSYSIVQTLPGNSEYFSSLDVLKDGRLIGCSINGVKIWNITTGNLTNYYFRNKWVSFIKVLRNGNVAAATLNNTITIFNPLNGWIIRTLKGHTAEVTRFCELNNGYLASGSADKTVKIWNLSNGKVIKTLYGHNDMVSSVATLKNGYLISVSTDSKINIWS